MNIFKLMGNFNDNNKHNRSHSKRPITSSILPLKTLKNTYNEENKKGFINKVVNDILPILDDMFNREDQLYFLSENAILLDNDKYILNKNEINDLRKIDKYDKVKHYGHPELINFNKSTKSINPTKRYDRIALCMLLMATITSPSFMGNVETDRDIIYKVEILTNLSNEGKKILKELLPEAKTSPQSFYQNKDLKSDWLPNDSTKYCKSINNDYGLRLNPKVDSSNQNAEIKKRNLMSPVLISKTNDKFIPMVTKNNNDIRVNEAKNNNEPPSKDSDSFIYKRTSNDKPFGRKITKPQAFALLKGDLNNEICKLAEDVYPNFNQNSELNKLGLNPYTLFDLNQAKQFIGLPYKIEYRTLQYVVSRLNDINMQQKIKRIIEDRNGVFKKLARIDNNTCTCLVMYNLSNGDLIYIGDFDEDICPHGKGIHFNKDYIYRGECKNNIRDGKGSLYNLNLQISDREKIPSSPLYLLSSLNIFSSFQVKDVIKSP